MACLAAIFVVCGLSGLPVLLRAGQFASASALLFTAWLHDRQAREAWTDYAMAVLSLSYIARFVLQETGVGSARISGLYLGLILCWLVRTIHLALVRKILVCFLAGWAAFLAVVWIAACHEYIQAALGFGSSDLTSLKVGFRAPIGGSNQGVGQRDAPRSCVLYALACFLLGPVADILPRRVPGRRGLRRGPVAPALPAAPAMVPAGNGGVVVSHAWREAGSALLDAAIRERPTPYYYSLRGLNTARQNMPAFQPNRPTAVTLRIFTGTITDFS